MLIYAIITWLFMLGVLICWIEKEIEIKEYKHMHLFGYIPVWILSPILVPIIIGYAIKKDK